MTTWSQHEWCTTLMLALGHFLWQGTLIAGVLALTRRVTRSAALRYWLSLAALVLMAVCPAVMWGWLLHAERRGESASPPMLIRAPLDAPEPSVPIGLETPTFPAEAAVAAPATPEAATVEVAPPGETAPPRNHRTGVAHRPWQSFTRMLTVVYLTGVAAMFLRLVVGLWGGRRLRQRIEPIDDLSLLRSLRQRAEALGLKLLPVVAYCDQVCVPTIVGVVKPMILLPLTLTSHLTPEQLEAVLAHELAHLCRGDHWVNLLQRLIEALLFFHPAMWWVSRRVREEREHCCDDLVIACGATPLEYVRSLLRVAELGQASSRQGAIAAVSLLATGGRPSQLRQRIARLLGESPAPSLRLSPRILLPALGISLAALLATMRGGAAPTAPTSPEIVVEPAKTEPSSTRPSTPGISAEDWPQWGGTVHRNNVAVGQTAPQTWSVETRDNIRWSAPLGSQTYSSPVIANGKVFIGTNNGHAYVTEHPATEDISCLLAFDVRSGKFLWQDSNRKLPSGRLEDWPGVGICSTPYCEGERLWYVTNRVEVVCLDAAGFDDGENDGPVTDEPLKGENHADVVWRFDMRERLGVRPRHAANCSVTCLGDRLFVVASHGAAEPGEVAPRQDVPSFICLDKRTGELLWSDASASRNVLECHWSSPCVFEAGGQWQVVMGGGDGWVYSFDPAGDGAGRARLLWKFDTNPKASRFVLGSQGTRNYCVATPVFYGGHLYVGNGQDPERGEGIGHLYCLDPTKRDDISAERAVDSQGQPLAPRRLQAVDLKQGEKAIPNPNSAVVWHYSQSPDEGQAKADFSATFHRTLGSPAIVNDLLFIADCSGVLHCLDAKKSDGGRPRVLWTHDLFAAAWGTPLIADGKVFVTDEDGDVTVFRLSAQKTVLAEHHFGEPIYSTPALADGTLFVATRSQLFAIAQKQDAPPRAPPNGQADTTARGAEQPELRVLHKPAALLPDHWIVQAIGWDGDGQTLITASNQSSITIRRWDLAGLKLLSEIKLQGDRHGRAVRADTLRFSGDRRRVVAATDSYVGIWDTATGELLQQLPFTPTEGIYQCAIDRLDCTPDLRLIVGHRALPGRLTLSYDAHLLVWDGTTGKALRTLIDQGATDLKALDLSTDGSRLVTTNGRGAKLWDPTTGEMLQFIPNDNSGRKHTEPDVSSLYTDHVWSVQLSPDGKRVAIGDILGVKLIDTATGKLMRQLEGPYRYSSGPSPDLVFSSDGEWLARLGTQESAGDGKHRYVVPIWSTRTGIRRFELLTEANAAAFSADGQRLAVAFSDLQQAVALWTLDRTAPEPAQPAGPGPHARQDRGEENGHYVGAKAAEHIERFQPTWGDTQLGLQYGIAMTKPQRSFSSGERVPLVAFFRNVSDKPIKFNTKPDYFGNTPAVLNAQGEPVALENIPLLGSIPNYHETLEPGAALGPFYLNIAVGENPNPGRQYWYPHWKKPVAGSYQLTHSVPVRVTSGKKDEPVAQVDLKSGTLTFEVAAPSKR